MEKATMEATIHARLRAAIERECNLLLTSLSPQVTPAQINEIWAREFQGRGLVGVCASLFLDLDLDLDTHRTNSAEGEGNGDRDVSGGDTIGIGDADAGKGGLEDGVAKGDGDGDGVGEEMEIVGSDEGEKGKRKGEERENEDEFERESEKAAEKGKEGNEEPTLLILDLLGPALHSPSLGPTHGRILASPSSGLFSSSSSRVVGGGEVLVEGQVLPDGIVFVDGGCGGGGEGRGSGGKGKGRGRIYWTNMGVPGGMGPPGTPAGGSVCCVELDEKDGQEGERRVGEVKTVIPSRTKGSRCPKQITYAPDRNGDGEGHLYFCDREGMAVRRCELDGQGLVTLVQTGDPDTNCGEKYRWCVGVAVDTRRGWLYWSQKGGSKAGEGRICRVRSLDVPGGAGAGERGDVEVLYEGLPEPVDLELDGEAQVLHWTDRGRCRMGVR
ncbi:hypothetical protein Q9189_008118 [Teloschistes chrysophthalmus]